MRLYVESQLPTDVDGAWDVYESAEYKRRLREQTRIQQEVLETLTEGEVEVRRIRTEPDRELPAMVAKALGTKRLSYVQTSRLDRAAGRVEWTVDLDGIGDRVRVSGTTTCVPAEGGCKRVIDGEISVDVPLIGRQIERQVVAAFEDSMRRANEVALAIIRERIA